MFPTEEIIKNAIRQFKAEFRFEGVFWPSKLKRFIMNEEGVL